MNSDEEPVIQNDDTELDDIEVTVVRESKRGLIERILSPESLQKMMACGGGLLVVGFVAWLWSIGLFASPVTVAGILGGVTLGAILGGVVLYKRTRYQLAGTGLTLLGSLALPLNLWFYDVQGLITLADGGHLWIPAALCCVIYAAVAWIMRNAHFVYAFVGGTVMTGMLFLADATVDRFWYLMPQVTFLVAIGWTCLIAGRQFPDGDSDFSRATFGRAFRRAGGLALTIGLILLGGGQVLAALSSVFVGLPAPLIATLHSQQLWAALILTATTAGLAVEYLLQKSRGSFGVASILTGLWSGVTVIDLLEFHPTVAHVLIGLALFTLAVNLVAFFTGRIRQTTDEADSARLRRLMMTTQPLALLLTAMAIVEFIGQLFVPAGHLLFSPTGWTLVSQLAFAAAAILTTGIVAGRRAESETQEWQTRPLMYFGAGTLTLAIWTTGMTLGWVSVTEFAVSCLVLPVIAALSACLLPSESPRARARFISWGAQHTALILIAVFSVAGLVSVGSGHLVACLVLGVAALNWYLTAASRGRATDSFCGHTAAGLAISQGLVLAGVDSNYSLALAPTMIGLVLSVVGPLLRSGSTGDSADKSSAAAPGLLVLLGGALGVLLAGFRMISGEQTMGLIAMLGLQLAATAITGLMAGTREWKLAFRTAAMAQVVALAASINLMLDFTWIQRMELGSLLVGTILLGLGHVAWSREGDDRDGMATAGLSLGSLAVVIPLAAGLIWTRLSVGAELAGWGLFHESATIVAGLLLLGAGLLCRVRSTTVGGATLLVVQVLSLVTLIDWPEPLQRISVLMMLGGGLFFTTAILLSIFRDHLMALPTRIREGEGVFQVFKWR